MIGYLFDFILPQVCPLCKEAHHEKGLLCPACRPVMTFRPPRWEQRGPFRRTCSLFEPHTPMKYFLRDPDRYREEIATCFFYQFLALDAPLPANIFGMPPLSYPLRALKRLFRKSLLFAPASLHNLVIAEKYPFKEEVLPFFPSSPMVLLYEG